MNESKKRLIKKSNRRAYMIVFTGFLCFFTIYGTAYNCLGLFMKPMSDEFGVPRAVISSLFTVTALCGFIFAPVIGRIVDKIDIKPVLLTGCLCMSLAYIIFSKAPSLTFLYVGAVVESIGICCTINMPVAFMIKNWFKKKQGLATGATIIGSGAGGAVLSQVVTAIISSSDWRTAYFVLGVIILASAVPFVILFAKKDPHSIGLYQYGELDDLEMKKERASVNDANLKLEELRSEYAQMSTFIKRKEFYLIFIGLFFVVFPTIGIKSHMVAYLTDLGYSPQISATVLTICLLASIPGAPALGTLFDKFGTIKVLIFSAVCLSLGCFSLAVSSVSVAFAFVFSAIYGFAIMIQPVGVPLIFTDILRTNTNFATIMSVTGLGMSLGSAFGTLIMGAIYDIFGTYVIGFIASGLSFITGFILLIIAVKIAYKKHVLIEDRVKQSI